MKKIILATTICLMNSSLFANEVQQQELCKSIAQAAQITAIARNSGMDKNEVKRSIPQNSENKSVTETLNEMIDIIYKSPIKNPQIIKDLYYDICINRKIE